MKLKIPNKTSEIQLKHYQHLMSNLITNKERGEWIIKNFSKRDPSKFDDNVKSSVFLTMLKLFESDKEIKAMPEIGEYRLPDNLLDIRVGHYIEIVNAIPDLESLMGADIVMGCLYRKDWSKDYSEKEIVDTAMFFLEQPLLYTLCGILTMKELFDTLHYSYPLLYDEKVNREADVEPTEDESDRQHELLHVLSEGVFIRKKEVKNRVLADAFSHLESIKKQVIKERLNEKAKNR